MSVILGLFDGLLATEDDNEPVEDDKEDGPTEDESEEDSDAEENDWESSVDDSARIDHFTNDE